MSSVTACTAAILVLVLGGDPAPAAVPGDAWLALIGFGVFSAFAVAAFLAGSRRIGAARAALLSTIEPVYTIVMATLLLGERLDPLQVLGGGLVVVGVLIAESGGSERPAGDQVAAVDAPPGDAERARV
jgi:drug/metabolite transporter (DMT)-like permease